MTVVSQLLILPFIGLVCVQRGLVDRTRSIYFWLKEDLQIDGMKHIWGSSHNIYWFMVSMHPYLCLFGTVTKSHALNGGRGLFSLSAQDVRHREGMNIFSARDNSSMR